VPRAAQDPEPHRAHFRALRTAKNHGLHEVARHLDPGGNGASHPGRPGTQSIEICCASLRQILEQKYVAELALGVNTESVSINKDEIDASIDLFHALKQVLDRHEQALRA
jgi:hypothetical protein